MRRTALAVLFALCSGSLPAAESAALKFDFSPSPLEELIAEVEKQKQTALVPRAARGPVIDGKLDDEAWVRAATVGFADNEPATLIRLCFDDQALYIATSATERPGEKPDRKPFERDMNSIWKDEHIEVWIDPTCKAERRYQFVLGASNSLYDLKDGKPAYNPDYRHAVAQTEKGWDAEIAIPLQALEIKAWPSRLGFNIGRNGPLFPPRSWNAEYGDTERTEIELQGVVPKPGGAAGDDAVEGPEQGEAAVSGASLRVVVHRPYARPQDRWIEADVALSPGSGRLDGTSVSARLFDIGLRQPVAEASAVPSRRQGRLDIDLRSVGLRNACLSIEFRENGECTGKYVGILSAAECDAPLRPGDRVKILVDAPPGDAALAGWPVHFGAPFPAGALWDASQLRLVDAKGRELPSQTEVTGCWAREGAIQWVRFDALVTGREPCYVEIGKRGSGSTPARPLTLSRQGEEITVETGVARYVLAKGASPIREILVGGKRVACADGTRGLYVIDQTGRVASASAEEETVAVEAAGPVASCVRFEGWYATADGARLARHITRVKCFAGQPFARVTHTLVLTSDTNEVWFKDIGWELAVAPGADPAAAFATSRDERTSTASHALADGAPSAYMLQDSHYRFGRGDNHFSVVAMSAKGAATTLAEGGECGDWAAVCGGDSGLAVHCHEAARQHPKEFEVRRDRVVLRLFSNRAGEELDFRPPTLVKKWNLAEWNKTVISKVHYDEKMPEKIAGFKTNAAGWSKTHELCFTPLPGRTDAAGTAGAMRRHSEPVYCHVAPDWVWQSEAMGPIHPRDPENFPHAEKAIDVTVDWWRRRVPEFGEFGFVDYYTGPHLWYVGKGQKYPGLSGHGYAYTYTLRHHLWLVYARAADRDLREFTYETNRIYMDGYMAHWDTATKTRGLYASSGMSDRSDGATKEALPFVWGDRTTEMKSSSTDLNQFIWLHHVTGHRRARDCVLEYIDGLKRSWTMSKPKKSWRAIMLLRTLTQCYAFTWDPALKVMADMTGDHLHDPESAIALTKERPYRGSPYKTQVDVSGLVEAWNIFGQKRYHDMALKVSRHWWDQWVGIWPVFYVNHQGLMANFLYRGTGDKSIVEMLKVQMKQAAKCYDPETGGINPNVKRPPKGAETATFMFEGIPYAQDLIVRSGGLGKSLTSWVAYNDYGRQASAVAFKRDDEGLEFNVACGALRQRGYGVGAAGGTVRIEPLRTTDKAVGSANLHCASNLNFVSETASGGAYVRIPKDAPANPVKIFTDLCGNEFFVLCRSKTPLVLHAPEYWQPLPVHQSPWVRIHFKVPEGVSDGAVFFEGSARLYAPDGAPFADGEPQHGWVDLPPDRPGLWSFEPVDNRLVRVRNVPPFFAFADPAHYFEPNIEWEREEVEEQEETAPDKAVFVSGAVNTPGNQALSLTGRRLFKLEAGEPHPSGVGGRFLPFHQGTIEFFFKPRWSGFEPPREYLTVVRIPSAGYEWRLSYMNDPKKNPENFFHVLYAQAYSDGPLKRITFRCYRKQTLFERNKWVHIAWVWGQRDGIYANHGKTSKNVLMTRIYVDGRAGRDYYYKLGHNLPADEPKALQLEGGLRAVVDELRISDCQRYLADFAPPSRAREFELDEHTRALFHFNGDVKGQSHGHAGALPVTLRE